MNWISIVMLILEWWMKRNKAAVSAIEGGDSVRAAIECGGIKGQWFAEQLGERVEKEFGPLRGLSFIEIFRRFVENKDRIFELIGELIEIYRKLFLDEEDEQAGPVVIGGEPDAISQLEAFVGGPS